MWKIGYDLIYYQPAKDRLIVTRSKEQQMKIVNLPLSSLRLWLLPTCLALPRSSCCYKTRIRKPKMVIYTKVDKAPGQAILQYCSTSVRIHIFIFHPKGQNKTSLTAYMLDGIKHSYVWLKCKAKVKSVYTCVLLHDFPCNDYIIIAFEFRHDTDPLSVLEVGSCLSFFIILLL